MENEYIVINKTELLKEIESLKYSLYISEKSGDTIRAGIESFEIRRLEHVLSQSTPLIPVVKDALYAKGAWYDDEVEDYLSNLKLGI